MGQEAPRHSRLTSRRHACARAPSPRALRSTRKFVHEGRTDRTASSSGQERSKPAETPLSAMESGYPVQHGAHRICNEIEIVLGGDDRRRNVEDTF